MQNNGIRKLVIMKNKAIGTCKLRKLTGKTKFARSPLAFNENDRKFVFHFLSPILFTFCDKRNKKKNNLGQGA